MALTKLSIGMTLAGIIKEKESQLTITRHKVMHPSHMEAAIFTLENDIAVLRRTIKILDEVMPEQIGLRGVVEEKIIDHHRE